MELKADSPVPADAPRVLLMGYRSGLADALKKAGVFYAVWSETPLKRPPAGVTVHVAPFGNTGRESRAQAKAWVHAAPFTHVVACTEASVLPASHARRVLSARLSVHTTVRTCHDKLVMKRRLAEAGVAMTDFVDCNTVADLDSLIARLGSPVVVKDRTSSGGSGIDFVNGNTLQPLRLRNRMAERFVDASEASVESFVHRGEVVFDNVTEYFRKGHVNILPAGPPIDTAALRSLNRRIVRSLRIDWGMTHMEAYLSPREPLFGEIALRPPGGYIMELLRLAYGFDAWRAFLAVELGESFAFPQQARACAAAIVLHPGAGRIVRIRGLREVRRQPAVVRARLRVAEGDSIDPRRSLGADIGHVLLRARDRPALLQAIGDVESTLRIDQAPDDGADPT